MTRLVCGCVDDGDRFLFCTEHAHSPEVEATRDKWRDSYTPRDWSRFKSDLIVAVSGAA